MTWAYIIVCVLMHPAREYRPRIVTKYFASREACEHGAKDMGGREFAFDSCTTPKCSPGKVDKEIPIGIKKIGVSKGIPASLKAVK